MIKRFYVLLWFLLIGSALASIFNASVSDMGLLAFALSALALVYGLALWAVLRNDPADYANDVGPGRLREQEEV